MSIDGFFVTALCRELSDCIVGGRIDKISMPDRLQAAISVRRNGVFHRLLASARSQYARLHLTRTNPENPLEPPMFCMVLRKHLLGGRILSVHQRGSERILTVQVEARDEYGRRAIKDLIVEIMGKHSNLLLVDSDASVIIDCAKHVSSRVNRYRELLPNKPYVLPPSQGKADLQLIANLSPDDVLQVLASHQCEQTAHKCLINRVQGLGPLTATEVLYRAGVDPDCSFSHVSPSKMEQIALVLCDILQSLREGRTTPVTYSLTTDGSPQLKAFSFMRLTHLADQGCFEQTFSTLGDMLDYALAVKEQDARQSAFRSELASVVSNAIQRSRERLSKLESSLEVAENADEFRLKADLLMTHSNQAQKGLTSLTVPNYFDPGLNEVAIELDPSLSVIENARHYYKLYSKAKRSKAIVESLIQSTRSDLAYLEQVEVSIDPSSTVAELEEISSELADQGVLRSRSEKRRRGSGTKERSSPAQFVSRDGIRILVGRNNRQNDELTLKIASPNDIWLHAKDIPGSHVIIRSQGVKEIPDSTLAAAALLAAFYSKARGSSNVAVDYTLRKHVRKPTGAKPGMVIYDSQTTVYVTPSEEAILSHLKEGSTLM